ncbi:MAG: hypothetical protein DRP79_02640 [Planctomycetota bacterium]|nr:MAG: hypothetical protein DRP79_02640 [Planctomycetota bacterium]
MELTKKMKSDKDKVLALTTIADLSLKAGDKETARAACKKAFGLVSWIKDLKEKTTACCDFALLQAKAGDSEGSKKSLDWAVSMVEKMDDAKSSSYHYALAAECQEKAGFHESAAATFARAVDMAKLQAGGSDKATSLVSVVAAQARAGLFTEAAATLEEIKIDRIKASAYRAIAEEQAGRGMFDKAVANAGAASKNLKEKAWAFFHIAGEQMEAGKKADALDSLKKAAAAAVAAASPMSAKKEAFFLLDVARSQAEAGDEDAAERTYEQALDAAERITNSWERADALCRLARVAVEAGYPEDAEAPLGKAIEAAGLTEEDRHDEKTTNLINIARVQAMLGDADATKKTCKAALAEAKNIRYASIRNVSISSISLMLAKAKLYEEAEKVIKENASTQWDWGYWYIASSAVKFGDLQVAVDAAGKMSPCDIKADALKDIALAYAKKGEADTARKLFAEALETARRIDDEKEKPDTVSEVIEAWLGADSTAEPGKIYESLKDEPPPVKCRFCIGVAKALKR